MHQKVQIFIIAFVALFCTPTAIRAEFLNAVSEYTTKPLRANNAAPIQIIDEDADAELKFTAEAMNDKVALNWSSAHQKNTDYFEVERSNDGVSWISIEKQKAAENCRVALYYESKDINAPEELCFYRIKTVYLDGTERFSSYAGVDRGNKKEYLIYFLNNYPNTQLNLVYSGSIKDVNYLITDRMGVKMDFVITQTLENKISFDMSQAKPGEYNVTLKAASGKEVIGSVWISQQE